MFFILVLRKRILRTKQRALAYLRSPLTIKVIWAFCLVVELLRMLLLRIQSFSLFWSEEKDKKSEKNNNVGESKKLLSSNSKLKRSKSVEMKERVANQHAKQATMMTFAPPDLLKKMWHEFSLETTHILGPVHSASCAKTALLTKGSKCAA